MGFLPKDKLSKISPFCSPVGQVLPSVKWVHCGADISSWHALAFAGLSLSHRVIINHAVVLPERVLICCHCGEMRLKTNIAKTESIVVPLLYLAITMPLPFQYTLKLQPSILLIPLPIPLPSDGANSRSPNLLLRI